MRFYPMPPDLAKHILSLEEDPLTEAHEQRLRAIKQTACPRCGSALHPTLDAAKPFGADPLPRMCAKCPECGYMTSPGGVIVDKGDPRKVEDPLPIIRPSRD